MTVSPCVVMFKEVKGATLAEVVGEFAEEEANACAAGALVGVGV